MQPAELPAAHPELGLLARHRLRPLLDLAHEGGQVLMPRPLLLERLELTRTHARGGHVSDVTDVTDVTHAGGT